MAYRWTTSHLWQRKGVLPWTTLVVFGSESVKGSRGWFDKFRKGTGIYGVVMHEVASANLVEAEKFVKSLKQYVNSEACPCKCSAVMRKVLRGPILYRKTKPYQSISL